MSEKDLLSMASVMKTLDSVGQIFDKNKKRQLEVNLFEDTEDPCV